MARMRLEFPDQRVLFTHRLEVRVGDLNYANHLGHDRLVTLLHEARVRFLRHFAIEEGDCDGAAMMVADLAVVYLAEVRHGQTLRVEFAVGDLGRSSCEVLHRVSDADSGVVAALARVRVVFVDPVARRVVGVPARFLALAAPQGADREVDPARNEEG